MEPARGLSETVQRESPIAPSHRSFLAGQLLISLALLVACGGGGGGSKKKPAPVTVTVLTTPCVGGSGAFPNTVCQHLRVDGQGNPPLDLELRVTEPVLEAPLLGTVLLGTGGDGDTFYADSSGGDLLIGELLAAGFRVVDRSWEAGWFSTGESVRQQSARYAALLSWVHDNVHTTGAFCATGNSAGSGEIAYALTTWEKSAILDVVVLSSGPPFSRIDYLCEDPIPEEWLTLCKTIVPPGVMDCGQPTCLLEPTVLCPGLPAAPQPGELEGDSVLHPGAALEFPGTSLYVLLGTEDCTSAVPQALLFHGALTGPATLEFVPGAPHLLQSTELGRAAIFGALASGAAGLPPSSASTTRYSWTIATQPGDDGEMLEFTSEILEEDAERGMRQTVLQLKLLMKN